MTTNTSGKTKTFSLRLTFEERSRLEEAANGVPLGAYIRTVLFGGDLKKIRRRSMEPVKDHAVLARALAALGQSRLSSNLNQLARAANTGTLPVHPDTEAEIVRACEDISKLRADFLNALGLDGDLR
ncbi:MULTISPECIES: hypothetical protein [Rhodobacterales]|uniref:hypothetical protein n=1 Tax=Rhodobacterales TaxID=204455 RepID=UPI0021A2B85F|nr:hypothetical protein [Leisingera aquaemixtae]UWQ37501.1 hypothetical protein K3552_00375 [Leisingera aquaemixtae]